MIKIIFFAVLAVFGGMLVFAASGHSAAMMLSRAICGDRVRMVRMVENTYGEKEMFNGAFGGSADMRIFVNPITKTFTIFLDSKEQFCVIAAGGKWKIGILGDDI